MSEHRFTMANRYLHRLTHRILWFAGVCTLLTSVVPQTAFGALFSSILPASRSGQVGNTLTAFANIINTGPGTATGCSISPINALPGTFLYQTTDPSTNALTGTPDTPVDIADGALQSFIIAFTPSAPLAPTDVQFSFDCINTNLATIISGVNTLLLSASNTPVPDIIAVASGTGTVDIPDSTGAAAFAVATVNVGTTGSITASADTGSAVLPVAITVCETNPTTGACINPTIPASTATTTIGPGATPTFAFFLTGSGPITFDPANNRVFARFTDANQVVRGATSVALTSSVVTNPTTTVTFNLSNFTEISVPTVFGVTVTQGPDFLVEVTVDEDVVNRVDVTQTGSRLNIALLPGDSNIQTLQAFVTMPVLNRIDLTGVVNASLNDFNQTQMTINVDGVSRLRGNNALMISNLTASVSGAASQLDFSDIRPLGIANINVSGVSRATLNMGIGSTMTGTVTGTSTLFYFGTNVAVNVTTNATSSVIKLGETRP